MEKGVERKKPYFAGCKMHSLISAVLIGILVGAFCGIWSGRQRAAPEHDEITYGISGQELHVQSVVWTDFPAWREVTFSINGSISFITDQNGRIVFQALANPEALEETRREHNVFSDGKDLVCYDEVTYEINAGKVNATIPKMHDRSHDDITDTVNNSFYLVFCEQDTEYIAGSILPLEEAYTAWTKEQERHFDTNIDAYMSAFMRSGTYDRESPLCQRVQKESIVLKKEEGSFLDCTIYNHGAAVWRYEAQLPHVELWYKGVWIELISPYAEDLMTVGIEPGQSRGFDIPDETVMQYPTLIDGVYRLVVYGENEEFVVSETFVVD